MKHHAFALLGFAGIATLAACSGGGAGGGGYVAPVSHMTAGPTSAPQPNSVLRTANIDGGQAFVTSSNLPVYTFSGDGHDVSNCTGSCLAAWPSVAPPAGALPAPWSSFSRSDNGAMQLAYNGAPLYTFAGDSPGVSNGNGTQGFSLARPAASATAAPTATPAPTAAPTSAPTSNPGPY